MITIGLLVWVGVQLGAPATFYILLGIAAMSRILQVGIDLGAKRHEK